MAEFKTESLGNGVFAILSDIHTFGTDAYNNTFCGNTYGNSVGMMCHGNVTDSGFYYNNIGDTFRDNTISTSFYANEIADYFYGNTVGATFYANRTGTYFYNNTIPLNTFQNTFGSRFYGNTTTATTKGIQQCTFGNLVSNNSFIRCMFTHFFHTRLTKRFRRTIKDVLIVCICSILIKPLHNTNISIFGIMSLIVIYISHT